MIYDTSLVKPDKGFIIQNSTLIILAFSTAFFPRCLESLGAPAPVNFIHFLLIPSACLVVLNHNQTVSRLQKKIAWQLLLGLFLLLIVTLASAIINHAGIINVILSFLLLGEPYLLLLAIISLSFTPDSFDKFRKWLIRFWLFHIFLAIVQRYIFRVDLMYTGMAPPDNVQGVFFVSGAGHVVGAAVSLTAALYYFFYANKAPSWFRTTVLITSLWQLLIADAKQVLLTFFISAVLLLLTKIQDIRKLILYIVVSMIIGIAFLWCLQNLEAFAAFNVWIRPELYGPNGDAVLLKTTTFRVVPQHYHSPLNWLFGLGPGHSVGRLGGWMLVKYTDIFGSLATIHPASTDVWDAANLFYINSRTSMFSPLFGWAGIWGSMGFLGLGAYLFLAFSVWQYICIDDFSKLIVLSVFVTGCIFSQMEEPGYMLSIAAILGLNWHTKNNKKLLQQT